jgi:hypothetical protein
LEFALLGKNCPIAAYVRSFDPCFHIISLMKQRLSLEVAFDRVRSKSPLFTQLCYREPTMTRAIEKQTLYDTDLNLWLETVISQLRSRDLENIDIENLIEELEGLAGRDKREVASRLKTLIEHILKRRYVDTPNEFRGWEVTIRTQRFESDRI